MSIPKTELNQKLKKKLVWRKKVSADVKEGPHKSPTSDTTGIKQLKAPIVYASKNMFREGLKKPVTAYVTKQKLIDPLLVKPRLQKLNTLSKISQKKLAWAGFKLDKDLNDIQLSQAGIFGPSCEHTPLHHASYIGDFDLLVELCDNGADLDKKAPLHHNMTALLFAGEQGCALNVQLLLARGAKQQKLNALSQTSQKKLAKAGFKLDKDLNDIQSLSGFGTRFEYTPLHHASYIGDFDLIVELCDNGADIDKETPLHQMTALSFAAEQGRALAVHLLLERGANLTQEITLFRDFFGRSICPIKQVKLALSKAVNNRNHSLLWSFTQKIALWRECDYDTTIKALKNADNPNYTETFEESMAELFMRDRVLPHRNK